MKKIFIVFVFFMLCFFSLVYAQQAEQVPQTSTIQGAVVDTDWVAGEMVVRSVDFFTPDEMTFMIDRNTKIIKGVQKISLADILQNTQVTVTYVSSLSGLKALQVNVRE